MRKHEFIDAVYDAGWRPSCDAQHTEIEKLWEKIFPSVAIPEDELEELRPPFNLIVTKNPLMQGIPAEVVLFGGGSAGGRGIATTGKGGICNCCNKIK